MRDGSPPPSGLRALLRRLPRRPRIGISTSRRKGRMMLFCNRLAVFLAGGWPVAIGPGRHDRLGDLDGLIIGGGVDVESRLYGVDTTDEWPYDPDRDALEIRALDWADREGKPVLGICRGAQLMNVHRGGTLILDLKTAMPDSPNPRSVFPCKWIEIEPDSLLHGIMRRRRTLINALHHQAVERLGAGFRVTARDRRGVVQAIEAPGPALWFGVQWHPEFLFLRPSQFRIFRTLVRSARERVAAQRRPPQRQSPTPSASKA